MHRIVFRVLGTLNSYFIMVIVYALALDNSKISIYVSWVLRK